MKHATNPNEIYLFKNMNFDFRNYKTKLNKLLHFIFVNIIMNLHI